MHESFVLPAVLLARQAKQGLPQASVAQDGWVLNVMCLLSRQMVQASGNLCLHREIPGYTHNYLECWVFELPIDNLKRKRAFGTGTMRTPVSALPVPGNPNG
jgi:hypothetical protein